MFNLQNLLLRQKVANMPFLNDVIILKIVP